MYPDDPLTLTLRRCLKIFFGVLTDTTPIAGRKRGPYLVGGWIGFIGCFLTIASDFFGV